MSRIGEDQFSKNINAEVKKKKKPPTDVEESTQDGRTDLKGYVSEREVRKFPEQSMTFPKYSWEILTSARPIGEWHHESPGPILYVSHKARGLNSLFWAERGVEGENPLFIYIFCIIIHPGPAVAAAHLQVL